MEDRIKKVNRFYRCLLICLSCVAATFIGGCQYGGVVSLLGTPSYEEEKIPAEYKLVEVVDKKVVDKKVLVLVNQPSWLAAQANLRYYLTRAINQNLATSASVKTENLYAYGTIADLCSQDGGFFAAFAAAGRQPDGG